MGWVATIAALIKLAIAYLGFAKAKAKKQTVRAEEKDAEAKVKARQEELAVTSPRTSAAIDKWLRERGF